MLQIHKLHSRCEGWNECHNNRKHFTLYNETYFANTSDDTSCMSSLYHIVHSGYNEFCYYDTAYQITKTLSQLLLKSQKHWTH